jgi:hypothetical protein
MHTNEFVSCNAYEERVCDVSFEFQLSHTRILFIEVFTVTIFLSGKEPNRVQICNSIKADPQLHSFRIVPCYMRYAGITR